MVGNEKTLRRRRAACVSPTRGDVAKRVLHSPAMYVASSICLTRRLSDTLLDLRSVHVLLLANLQRYLFSIGGFIFCLLCAARRVVGAEACNRTCRTRAQLQRQHTSTVFAVSERLSSMSQWGSGRGVDQSTHEAIRSRHSVGGVPPEPLPCPERGDQRTEDRGIGPTGALKTHTQADMRVPY